jgi:hypothetical protein
MTDSKLVSLTGELDLIEEVEASLRDDEPRLTDLMVEHVGVQNDLIDAFMKVLLPSDADRTQRQKDENVKHLIAMMDRRTKHRELVHETALREMNRRAPERMEEIGS